MVIEDWNRLPMESPAAQFVANGAAHYADDVETLAIYQPTHRAKHIDYAVVKGSYPTAREQYHGLLNHGNGHALIIYELDADRWPKARKWKAFSLL